MIEDRGRRVVNVAGILLFGKNPNRWLPQAGITAIAYEGNERDYATRDESRLRGPIVPLVDDQQHIEDRGLIDQALDFIERNVRHSADLEGARRRDRAAP